MQLRASRRSRLTVQLDDPIGTDKEGNEVRLTDLLGTDKDEVSDAAEIAIESTRALRLLQTELLDDRERRVLQMRYGLLDGTPRAQHEVAKALGISRSYVSRNRKKRRWRSFAGRWAVEAPPSLCYNDLPRKKVARQGGSPCTTTTLSPPCF